MTTTTETAVEAAEREAASRWAGELHALADEVGDAAEPNDGALVWNAVDRVGEALHEMAAEVGRYGIAATSSRLRRERDRRGS